MDLKRQEFDMRKNLITAVLMTIVTTVLLGVIYPLTVTGLHVSGRTNPQAN